MRAEVDEEHRSQRWVNARRRMKFLGHSSSAEPSLQAGNVGAADYAESTEVGDETRYVTDARARSPRLGSLGRLGRGAFSDLSFGDTRGAIPRS